MSDIVPFGKHKGKPVEALLDDREYLDWLLSQSWFQQRYGNIYQIVINNGQEPSETPEHNAMQIKFLDEDFRLRFAYLGIGQTLLGFCDGAEIRRRMAQLEDLYSEVSWYGPSPAANKHGIRFREYKKSRGVNLTDKAPLLSHHVPIFETKNGADVEFLIGTGVNWSVPYEIHSYDKKVDTGREFTFCVEIKPAIGDDYPAILRQLKRNQAKYLFLRSYTGQGATEEQFVQFFASQGIKVVFETDVDAAVLPPFDRELAI